MIKVNYSKYINNYYFLQDSFLGGENYKNPEYTVQTIAKTTFVDEKPVTTATTAKSYLIPHRQEGIEAYRLRQNTAVYLNLVEPIISAYTAPLEQVTRVFTNDELQGLFEEGKEFYDELDYPAFVKFVAEQTAEFGHVFVVIDYVTDNSGKVTAVKPLILNPIQVKDVYLSDEDHKFVALSWDRADGKTVVASADGFDILESDKVIQNIPLLPGITFPIKVVYFQKDMSKPYPMGMSLVSDTAEIGKKIYNLSSWLDEVAKNTGFPILALPFNQENGAIPPESKLVAGTAKGIAYPANAGAPQWIEPAGHSAEQLRQMIQDEIKKAFQMKGLNSFEMIDSSASSGVSIKIRNSFYESKAKTFLQNIRSMEVWLMEMTSAVLGLTDKQWVISYPINLVAPDASAQIQNWISLLQTAKTYGRTITPELFKTVFGEILDQGFSVSQEQKDRILEALDSPSSDSSSSSNSESDAQAETPVDAASEVDPAL